MFAHPEWRAFAARVVAAHEVDEEPEDVRIRQALPVLAARISSLQSQMNSRQTVFEHGLASIQQAMADLPRSVEGTVERAVADVRRFIERAGANVTQSMADDGFRTRTVLQNGQGGLPTGILVPPAALPAESLEAILHGAPPPVVNAAAAPRPPVSAPGTLAVAGLRDPSSFEPGRGTLPAIGPNVPCEPEGWPTEPISPAVMSVHDAWREWKEGLGPGMPSIQALDAHWDRRWRYKPGNAMNQWHSRRRKLVLYVEWRLRQAGFDPDARDPAAQESLDGILDELDARRTGSLSH